ncbi:hypothetical protein PENPOL_c013G09229 [Penicillium polonicum]|uniref:Uncharacterized protein n=1 Tax=Penicillium polonicum TaxID=60169 RepID=A0A1V6NC63_PENPO|nr:hypothetical protein PENPOL_c013G09229 [Penicillium polonicum]
MNRKSMRNYQPTKRRLIQFIGSPLEDVVTKNGTNGERWRDTIEAVCNSIKKADRKIVFANILGANAHLSSTDKDDMQEVISVSLLNKSGTSVSAIHLHLDGTWKLFTRGHGIKARHAAKIDRANLPGYMSTKGTP